MENERYKKYAELQRISTAILWNVQVSQDSRMTHQELWPFPWDENPVTVTEMSEEERERVVKAQVDFLNKIFPAN
jgi:hypothetical protein